MKMYFRVFKYDDKIRVCLCFECNKIIKHYPIDLTVDDFSNEILSNYDFIVENNKLLKEKKENGK